MTVLLPRKISRRGALRGIVGGIAATVGLPYLDIFLNNTGTALANGAPIPMRFGTWFWGLGHTVGRAVTADRELKFLAECAPLEPYRKLTNFYSNFNTPLDGRPSAVHYTGWIGCRTGSVPNSRDIGTSSKDILEPTLDVIAADAIGMGARFKSIDMSATGDPSDSYTFRGAGSRNTAEISPLALYARIYGPDFVDPNVAEFKVDPKVMVRRSALSVIADERAAFTKTLGTADKHRLEEYFTSLRQLEGQLDLQMQKPPPAESCAIPKKSDGGPTGVEIPVVFANHKQMTDLAVMALACNQTRIVNMLYSNSQSSLRVPGESFTHHTLTHEEQLDKGLGYQARVAVMNLYSMQAFAQFLEAFSKVREGDGTLLDNMLIFANSDTNNARIHALDGTPVMTVGRAGGRMKTGLHIDGKGDPITRTGLTALQAVGVPIAKWGTLSLETSRPITDVLV